MKNGVPYDAALNLSQAKIAAFGIIFGEFEGGEFDLRTMSWKERK